MKKGLGKGLSALISLEENDQQDIKELRVNEIEPNKGQPRKKFDDNKLEKLADSIKKHGIVQPIIVKKDKDIYRIVAGERRWRAARIAGLDTVPVIIKELSDRQHMEIALIENLQREDLNAVEEAEAYERLLKEHNLTQEDIAAVIGKSRPAIANSLRLLSLPQEIRQYIIEEKLTGGHARAIISLENEDIQKKAADEIIKKGLSVREAEKLVKTYMGKKNGIKKNTSDKQYNDQYIEIEEKLKNIFGTKVKLMPNNKKGKILIEYYSNEDLERIIEMVNSIQEK